MKIGLVRRGHDVQALYEQLQNPAIWDTIRLRTMHPQSPHRDIHDIWVRYNAFENFNGNMHEFNGPHESVWYPVIDVIPEAKRISEDVAHGRPLGAVLITKIPAGKMCHPHVDAGWHAANYVKHGVQVRGNERQAFHVEDENLVTVTGDEFFFDNSKPHWVINDSDEDRITMIVCFRSH